jgi:hypothetical protein
MARTQIRPWLIGCLCIACGVVSQITFTLYSEPGGHAEMVITSCFESCWYGAGLALALIDVIRLQAEATGGAGRKGLAWALWGVAALAALAAVLWSMPP